MMCCGHCGKPASFNPRIAPVPVVLPPRTKSDVLDDLSALFAELERMRRAGERRA